MNISNISKHLRAVVLLSLGLLSAVLSFNAASTTFFERDGVVMLHRIGHPIWKPVDFHLFSAPIGTSASGYAEFAKTAQTLLPAPDHLPHPQLFIGPGEAHSPPYDNEIEEGVAKANFHEGGAFKELEFSNGNGVYLVWMNVASPGVKGSSPDSRWGRIIPNKLFPIHIAGTLLQDGQPYDPKVGTFDVPALTDTGLTPSFAVDGASHFPVFFADNADFGPAGASVRGSYTYQIVMTDQAGNGWRIVANFSVGRREVVCRNSPSIMFPCVFLHGTDEGN